MARRLYPVFLDISDRLAVVVGGGAVAERKAIELIECRAQVRIVAPATTRRLQDLAAEGRVEWLRREFDPGDIDKAFVVFAATNERAVNTRVCQACAYAGIIVNRVESPEASDFLVPATLRRGPLTVAVSTGGASPALAAQIRDELARQFGPEYAGYLSLLEEARLKVTHDVADAADRRRALMALAKDNQTLEIFRREGEIPARKHIEKILEAALIGHKSG